MATVEREVTIKDVATVEGVVTYGLNARCEMIAELTAVRTKRMTS